MKEQENKSISTAAITDAPANVTAIPIDASKILVRWEAAAGAEGYHVFRSTTQNGVYALAGETASTAFLDTNLASETTYFYQVAAYDADGDGPRSASAGATTAAAPAAPQNLTAAAAGPTQINTVWEAVAGAVRYNVYRSTTADGPYELVGLTAAPSYTDTGLRPDTVYYYRVSAVAGDIESALSNLATAATDADLPVPDNVLAVPVSQTQINVSWNEMPDAMAYVVYRSTTPDGTYQYISTTAEPFYSDTGLLPGTVYYYRVAVVIGGMEGSPSAYAVASTFPMVPEPPCRPCCCPYCGCNPCCCHREPRNSSRCR